MRNAGESVMRALLLLVQLDLTRAVADVIAAAGTAARARNEERAANDSHEAAAAQLRQVAIRTRIDPALLEGVRRIYRSERVVLNDARTRLAAALDSESRARVVVADLRGQERTYQEALRRYRKKQLQQRQAADVVRADELWLQRYGVQPR